MRACCWMRDTTALTTPGRASNVASTVAQHALQVMPDTCGIGIKQPFNLRISLLSNQGMTSLLCLAHAQGISAHAHRAITPDMPAGGLRGDLARQASHPSALHHSPWPKRLRRWPRAALAEAQRSPGAAIITVPQPVSLLPTPAS